MLQETVDTFEQVQQLIVKHVPVPQMLQETVDTFERVQQQIVEHVPVPQMLRETVDPSRRVQQQTVVDVPVPQVLQETFDPLERGQQQTVVRRLWYPSRKCRKLRAGYKSCSHLPVVHAIYCSTRQWPLGGNPREHAQ